MKAINSQNSWNQDSIESNKIVQFNGRAKGDIIQLIADILSTICQRGPGKVGNAGILGSAGREGSLGRYLEKLGI